MSLRDPGLADQANFRNIRNPPTPASSRKAWLSFGQTPPLVKFRKGSSAGVLAQIAIVFGMPRCDPGLADQARSKETGGYAKTLGPSLSRKGIIHVFRLGRLCSL